eukprot:366216-Chlamydomonas_euryale.AAC.8
MLAHFYIADTVTFSPFQGCNKSSSGLLDAACDVNPMWWQMETGHACWQLSSTPGTALARCCPSLYGRSRKAPIWQPALRLGCRMTHGRVWAGRRLRSPLQSTAQFSEGGVFCGRSAVHHGRSQGSGRQERVAEQRLSEALYEAKTQRTNYAGALHPRGHAVRGGGRKHHGRAGAISGNGLERGLQGLGPNLAVQGRLDADRAGPAADFLWWQPAAHNRGDRVISTVRLVRLYTRAWLRVAVLLQHACKQEALEPRLPALPTSPHTRAACTCREKTKVCLMILHDQGTRCKESVAGAHKGRCRKHDGLFKAAAEGFMHAEWHEIRVTSYSTKMLTSGAWLQGG